MHKILFFLVFQIVFCSGLLARQAPVAKTDTSTISILFSEYLSLRESNPSKALECLQNGILIARQVKSQEKLALLLYHKGYMYRILGIYSLALRNDFNALTIYEKLGEQNEKSWLLIDIGLVYLYHQANFTMALDHFNRALNTFTVNNNKIGVVVATYDIGLAYSKMGKYTEALKYFNLAVTLSQQCNEAKHEATAYSLIGQTYILMNDLTTANKYFQKAFKIYSKMNWPDCIAGIHQNFAYLASLQGFKEESLANYNSALAYYTKIANQTGIAETYTQIAALYFSINDAQEAAIFAEKALAVADSNRIVGQQILILPILSDYYAKLNQLPKAYYCLKRFNDLKESNNVKYAQQLEAEYVFQNELQEKQLQEEVDLKRNIIIGSLSGGLALFLALSLLVFFKNRQLRKSYQHLFLSNVAILQKDEELAELNKQSRYNRSTLKNEQQQTLLNDLIELMEVKKEYLKNDLNLDDLAKQLNTNRTYVSQIINDNFSANFSNFINDYRVKEAQSIFLNSSSKNLTIEAIAQNVGFNSKSSFNTAFKKFTGLTPSDFMEMKSLSSKSKS